MKFSQMISALSFHAQNRMACGIVGAPGVGKSEGVFQVAADVMPAAPVIVMNLGLSDQTDGKGLPFMVTDERGRFVQWVKDQRLPTDTPIVLFLDEYFQASTPVQATFASMILEKRIDDLYLHPDSWVVFASNRMEDKAGTNRTPSHVPNRCTILHGPDVDSEDWSEWALLHGQPIELIQFLRMRSGLLHDWDSNRMINATPRQWAAVGTMINAGIPDDIRFDCFSGRVGEGPTAELIGFLKIAAQLPPKEQILMNPKTAPVPEDPSALYAVTGMLAKAATVNNFENVVTYMDRTPPEFQAMLVKDVMKTTPGVTSTKAFVKWGVKFAEVLR